MILFTIGRNPHNKIVINHPSVSGYHAEVKVRDDGSIYLTDKGSTNGTTFKGKRILTEVEVSVNRGEKITFAGVADLDWNKIPIITPPPIGWKLYSIGSDLNNRIQINDTSGFISRFHATLKIEPNGKMYINDHSSNGTFVNGTRIPANQDYPVKRKDKILFSSTQYLDWNKVKEKGRINALHILAPVAAMLVIALGLLWNWHTTDEKIFKKYSDAVVLVVHHYQIVAQDYKGNIYTLDSTITGTAFFVDSKGTLLTNRHITMPWEESLSREIDELKRIFVEYDLGEGVPFSDFFNYIKGETVNIGVALNNTDIGKNYDWSDFIACAVISKNTDHKDKDIGFLKTKTNSLPSSVTNVINIQKTSSFGTKKDHESKYANGKKIYVLGYPYSVGLLDEIKSGTTNTMQIKLTCQTGNINNKADDYKFGVSAQMTNGASGSPVLDEFGNLIGVFNSGVSSTQGLNYAILSKHAKQLYDEIQ